MRIGNPGNTDDTAGEPNPVGSVDDVYRIGKFEISRKMIEKANAEGNLGITLEAMDFVTGGARRDMPATGVSWIEAARFTNWLNLSQSFPAAYKFRTQPGDVGYDVNEDALLWATDDPGFDPANQFRNSRAYYFLPSVDEWYKAAYYDPNTDGGRYWEFPTAGDTAPTAVVGGTDTDSAVYSLPLEQGPADIDSAGGLSAYGVMALGGNVEEWNESEFDLLNDEMPSVRGLRGGAWRDSWDLLPAGDSGFAPPTRESLAIGFRVASIPEPSAQLLGLVGTLGLLRRRQRKRGAR